MKKKGTAVNDHPDRLNVIVNGSRVLGDMIIESNLRIDGEIKGNVTSTAKVVIGKSGIITGDLVCNDADIEGSVTGKLKVENLLSLKSTASINGEISTAKIEIEEGAQFSGNIKMSNHKAPAKEAVKQEDVVY